MTSIIKVDQIEPNTQQMVAMKIGGQANYMIPSFVGQLTSFRLRRATSQAFPFWNLSLPDQTLNSANYPDYVDYLRSIKIETCLPVILTGTVSTSGNNTTITFTSSQTLIAGTLLYFHTVSQFRIVLSGSGTSYVIDESVNLSPQAVSSIDQSQYSSAFSGIWSGTAFTLTDNAQNKILLDALTEDAYYSGASLSGSVITPIDTTNWLTLRWGTTDINIISFNPTTRVINVASGTPSGATIELYPHRTLVSTQARHKQVEDSALINNGIQVVSGLRLRDRIQGHGHTASASTGNPYHFAFNGYVIGTGFVDGNKTPIYQTTSSVNVSVTNPSNDGTNGNPRQGQFTRPRGLGVYFYEYVGRVI